MWRGEGGVARECVHVCMRACVCVCVCVFVHVPWEWSRCAIGRDIHPSLPPPSPLPFTLYLPSLLPPSSLRPSLLHPCLPPPSSALLVCLPNTQGHSPLGGAGSLLLPRLLIHPRRAAAQESASLLRAPQQAPKLALRQEGGRPLPCLVHAVHFPSLLPSQ